mgnify:CR=1 FL=1|jgi:hypothetical protein
MELYREWRPVLCRWVRENSEVLLMRHESLRIRGRQNDSRGNAKCDVSTNAMCNWIFETVPVNRSILSKNGKRGAGRKNGGQRGKILRRKFHDVPFFETHRQKSLDQVKIARRGNNARRDGRAADCATLEMLCPGNRTGGSNPPLSAYLDASEP